MTLSQKPQLDRLRAAFLEGTDADTGDVWLHREDADLLAALLSERQENQDRIAELEEGLGELRDAAGAVMGSLAYYIGPNARMLSSRENHQKYARVKAARERARSLLSSSGGD